MKNNGKFHSRWLHTSQTWQINTFSNVEIEEITVESRLHTASHNSYQVIESFSVVPEDPVHNVEATVRAKSKQVVGGNGLSLPCLGDHVELGHDGYRLQVDGECPENLWREAHTLDTHSPHTGIYNGPATGTHAYL